MGNGVTKKELHTPPLCIDVEFSHDLEQAAASGATATITNRRAAIQSLLSRRTRHDASQFSATLVVHLLSPAQLLAALVIAVGRRSHDVGALFDAFGCADLPDAVTEQVDAEQVALVATLVGAVDEARDGLHVVEALLGPCSWAARVLKYLPEASAGPHALEWARYGPDALSRSPELRPAFLWSLSLLSIPTITRKTRFIAASLRSRDDQRAPLVDITSGVVKGLRSSAAPKTTRELCYWVGAGS
jgi:hypothetical protein